MVPEQLKRTTSEILSRLARGEYDSVVNSASKSRLTSNDLRAVIEDYGRHLIPPPPEASELVDAIRVDRAVVPTWSVRTPVWTREEGRSDLTLELTISIDSGRPSVELDDLHVL
jgi:hypothetical protein